MPWLAGHVPTLAVLMVATLACLPFTTHQLEHRHHHCHNGFYVHHHQSVFYHLALKSGTDKVTQSATPGSKGHAYEGLYTKYFETNRRNAVSRLLEIGLGCTMDYGPGASSKLWRWYFPQATIYQAEYSRECVDKHMDKLDALNIKPLIGDQSNTATLHEWIRSSGGHFDVIIDDGGHTNMQQYSSFLVLFLHALKPGGVYFLEDLQTGRLLVDGDKQHIMQDVIKDWIEILTLEHGVSYAEPAYSYKPRFTLPPRIKFIDCGPGICAFVKCYHDDERCTYIPGVDHTLEQYTFTGTDNMTYGK